LSEELDYYRAKDILDNELFYYHLFNKGMKDNFIAYFFNESWKNKTKKQKADFFNSENNADYLRFDQFNEARDYGITGIIEKAGSSISSIIGLTNEDFLQNQAITGKIIQTLSVGASTYNNTSLKSLRDMNKNDINKYQTFYQNFLIKIMQKMANIRFNN
jgi:hypothetical protein